MVADSFAPVFTVNQLILSSVRQLKFLVIPDRKLMNYITTAEYNFVTPHSTIRDRRRKMTRFSRTRKIENFPNHMIFPVTAREKFPR